MVKGKGKKRVSTNKGRKRTIKKRKNKQANSLLKRIQKFFVQVLLVIICSIVLFFLYDYLYPEEIDNVHREEVVSVPSAGKEKESGSSLSQRQSSSKFTSQYYLKDLEIPRLEQSRKEQIIRHEGYTVSYNSDFKIANWVAWDLTKEEAQSKKAVRTNNFVPDPEAKGATAYDEDYKGTGFDRGHLAPAADMKWSAKAMRESFYFSNICPQNKNLNKGVWNSLEQKSRQWSMKYDTLLIVAGPVIQKDMRRLGKNRVGVPSHFYKVICTMSDGNYEGIGFLFENTEHKNVSLIDYAIPIDSVEKVTGIDFFYLIPERKQKKMESEINISKWFY